MRRMCVPSVRQQRTHLVSLFSYFSPRPRPASKPATRLALPVRSHSPECTGGETKFSSQQYLKMPCSSIDTYCSNKLVTWVHGNLTHSLIFLARVACTVGVTTGIGTASRTVTGAHGEPFYNAAFCSVACGIFSPRLFSARRDGTRCVSHASSQGARPSGESPCSVAP